MNTTQEAPAQAAQTEAKKIRLMKHYATDGTTKARCWYHRGTDIHGQDGVTIYGKDYQHGLYEIFGALAKNDSDMMTDYFENDRVRITPENLFFAEACARAAGRA